ncbi:MAG: threonine synthase [Alphaproteobacteria bacterium RIFCSPHIGHO2_02_FULL_46_13]|nr:MAG: threonine synthase [Alphaproteobacteria bacterium RIFCSPHIGHO2_02_FULL_46_13]
MDFISTRGGTAPLQFTDILLQGLATDGGLFVPRVWPKLEPILDTDSYTDIAYKVISPFTAGAIPEKALRQILDETYSTAVFKDKDIAPLRAIGDDLFLMELFHGPTLAFKDVALQFLGRIFDYVLEQSGQKITIVGATSGDTGSAAIEACKGRKNISITILHPKGRTSDIQRSQMTSVIEDNVHNIAIEGTFDDCQNLVKQAFGDSELRNAKNLSAVNSINWARIMAQTVYYVAAAKALKTKPVFAVPTGNFGNVYAAFVGKQMGANIGPLVIGSNRNDILTRFFETGAMTLESVTPSHSPSMDIQISSNFERVLFELTGRDADKINTWMRDFKDKGKFKVSPAELEKIRSEFAAYRCSDEQTVETISRVYRDHHELIDPHTAVGLSALEQSGHIHRDTCVTLACAHPAKFPSVVKAATGITPALPAHLSDLMERPEKYQIMDNDFQKLRAHLMGT